MQLSGRAARQALNAHIGCLVECTVNDGGAPEPLAYIKMCLSPKDAGRAHQLKFGCVWVKDHALFNPTPPTPGARLEPNICHQGLCSTMQC